MGAASQADRSLGVGQSLQDVTSSRALATVYYNTTGRSIVMLASLNGSSASVSVNGVIVASISLASAMTIPFSVVIPAGASYSASATSSISRWFELR